MHWRDGSSTRLWCKPSFVKGFVRTLGNMGFCSNCSNVPQNSKWWLWHGDMAVLVVLGSRHFKNLITLFIWPDAALDWFSQCSNFRLTFNFLCPCVLNPLYSLSKVKHAVWLTFSSLWQDYFRWLWLWWHCDYLILPTAKSGMSPLWLWD